MLTILRELNRVLSARDRLLAAGVLLVVILMAGVEVLGVGAVFWFISELANPDGLTQIKPLADLRMVLGMPDRDDFLIWIGGLLLIIMIFRNLLQIFSVWAQQSFILFRNHAFAERLLHAYLRRPYAAYLRSHTSELSKNLLNEVNRVASGVLYPVVNSVSCMAILVSITAFLLFHDPVTTAVIALVVGLLALLCYLPLHRKLDRLGRERMAADAMRFRAISDALSSIKDVRVLGREAYFLDRFLAASHMFMRRELLHKVLSQIPHFTLEIVAVFGILGGALYAYTNHPESAPQMVATLGLYAVAAYRLLPQVKSILRDFTDLRFSIASLESLANDIEEGMAYQAIAPTQRRPLPFHSSIELNDVSFAYEGSATTTLHDISLKIASSTSVAFVGPTGAGKTTLIDLILGLLHPTSGTIRVDGQVLTPEIATAWQANVGYVPQSIFLTDDSIRRNIAFGIADDFIVDADVRRAAQLANLDTFAESLPNGYDTPIGECGIRLSGGQRQRIGIARALYHRPRLLVMDEGTSALDGGTERAIADAIAGLTPEMTVILIAHRLATVRSCHTVFLIQSGRLVDQGSFDVLLTSNAQFRQMAELA